MPTGPWYTDYRRLSSSGIKAASVAIKAAEGVLGALIVLTDGTNAATATLYDNASAASGTELCQVQVPGASLCNGFAFPNPIAFGNGCYLELAGTGAEAIVYYY